MDSQNNLKILNQLIVYLKKHNEVLVKNSIESSNKYYRSHILLTLITSFIDLTNSFEGIYKIYHNKEEKYPSITSMYTIARAIFESYSTLVYLYFETIEKEHQKLRFLIYEYNGLYFRNQNPKKRNVGNEFITKFLDEQDRLNKIKSEIEQNDFFFKT